MDPGPRAAPAGVDADGLERGKGRAARAQHRGAGDLGPASRCTTLYGSVAFETTNPLTVAWGFQIVTVTDSDPEPVANLFLPPVALPKSSSLRGDRSVHLDELPTTKPKTFGFEATLAVRP